MRLSTSTCMFFNRPGGKKATIQESIRLCAKAGYRVMDMNFHDCCVFDTPFQQENWQQWILNIQEVAQHNAVEFSQGHSHFYNFCDEATPGKEQLDELIRRCIVGAGMLGIKWLVIHAGTDFASPRLVQSSRKKNVEYFKPLVEFAAQHNVGIALENLWELNISPLRRYTTTAEELLELVELLPYENVGCCWDVEHAALMQQDQHKALSMLGSKLKATHISDYTSVQNDHILPFSGLVDWQHVMDALRSCKYQGDFTYETHRYTQNLPDELVLPALEYSVKVGNHLLGMAKQ